MDENAERRRYYPNEENVPISVAITETVDAHENSVVSRERFSLFDHIDPDALNRLFTDTVDVDFSMQFHLPSATISVWGDGGIDIRVTDTGQ